MSIRLAMSTGKVRKKKDERLDAVFHALADGTRRRIVDRLARGTFSVSELAAPFEMSLAAISKHLDVLEEAGVVRRERQGRFQRCSLDEDAFDEASDFIQRYRAFWDANLDQLAEHFARRRK